MIISVTYNFWHCKPNVYYGYWQGILRASRPASFYRKAFLFFLSNYFVAPYRTFIDIYYFAIILNYITLFSRLNNTYILWCHFINPPYIAGWGCHTYFSIGNSYTYALETMPFQQKISSDTNCGMPQTLANKMIFWDHTKNLFWCAMKPTRYKRKLLDPKTNFLTNKKKNACCIIATVFLGKWRELWRFFIAMIFPE